MKHTRLKKATLFNVEVGSVIPFDGGTVKVHYISNKNTNQQLNQRFLDTDNTSSSIEYTIQYLDGNYVNQWSTYDEPYFSLFVEPENDVNHVLNNVEEFLNDPGNW